MRSGHPQVAPLGFVGHAICGGRLSEWLPGYFGTVQTLLFEAASTIF